MPLLISPPWNLLSKVDSNQMVRCLRAFPPSVGTAVSFWARTLDRRCGQAVLRTWHSGVQHLEPGPRSQSWSRLPVSHSLSCNSQAVVRGVAEVTHPFSEGSLGAPDHPAGSYGMRTGAHGEAGGSSWTPDQLPAAIVCKLCALPGSDTLCFGSLRVRRRRSKA